MVWYPPNTVCGMVYGMVRTIPRRISLFLFRVLFEKKKTVLLAREMGSSSKLLVIRLSIRHHFNFGVCEILESSFALYHEREGS